MMDLSTGSNTTLYSGNWQESFDISGNRVIWTEYSSEFYIKMMDLSTGSITTLINTPECNSMAITWLFHANFTANVTSGYTPLTVGFNDTSPGDPAPTSWLWDFGDGIYSAEQNPIHTYTSIGNFSVNLTVSNGAEAATIRKTDFIQVKPVPVVLVHGWRGSPEVWNHLVHNMTGRWLTFDSKTKYWKPPYYTEKDPGNWNYTTDDVWIFDYTSYSTKDPKVIASALQNFTEQKRDQYHYKGKIDIVCHSMGALVSRYYMENIRDSEGVLYAKNVRQWIGVSPVNHGAAIADRLWPLLRIIIHIFFPQSTWIGLTPSEFEMMTNSKTVRAINGDGIDPDVIYRVMVGYNSNQSPSYPSILFGRTLDVKFKEDGWWRSNYNQTFYGDGVVALAQSYLVDGGLDCFGMEDHNSAPHAKAVIDKILSYLQNPDLPKTKNWPTTDSGDEPFNPDNFVQSVVFRNGYKDISFSVDPSIQTISPSVKIYGSEINFSLISPSGKVFQGNDPGVRRFYNDGIQSLYIIGLTHLDPTERSKN